MSLSPYQRTPAHAWFQPMGWWRERGATNDALRLAMGLEPEETELKTDIDQEGYSLWHYWAEGSHAERRFDKLSSIKSIATKKYIDHLSKDGEHPWHRLMLRGQLQAAQYWFSKFGLPDLSLRNKHGDDLLMAACWSGNHQLVTWLLEMGAQPSGKDNQGLTALMIAIHRCPQETVMSLIMAGADPAAVDKQRKNSLHHAAARAMVDIFPTLEDAGADSEAVDCTGTTPQISLEKALRNEHLSIETAQTHWFKRYQNRLTF